ncbi:MAG: hypothetical protein OHK0022_32170 [Roseiflexaceae bacterium]
MTASQLNILIIGGGLGGLCLAQRLKAAGVRVAVYERHPPNFWPKGYLVHVNPVGRQIAGWHPALRRLVAESGPASITQYPIKVAVGVSPWTSGTVTLLGAAHPRSAMDQTDAPHWQF